MNTDLLNTTPRRRTLVLKTEDLDQSVGLLAAFCGVSAVTIRPAHENTATRTWEGLRDLPAQYIYEQAEVYCSDVMEKIYGREWRDVSAVHWHFGSSGAGAHS